MSRPARVLVVGAGPTGLALALSLTRAGISVRVIDAKAGPATESRALDVQARTLEHYRQLQVVDEVLARGVRIEQLSVRDDGRTVTSTDISTVGAGLSPYPFILCCPQDDHESVLVEALAAAGVAVEWNTELVATTEVGDFVTATLDRADGTATDLDVSYLCGCDGAGSTVRRQLNVPFPGGTYAQDYFVADVTTEGSPSPSSFSFCLSPHDFILVVPARRTGTQRCIGLVPPTLTGRDVRFDDLRAMAERATGLQIDAVSWFSTYQVSHRVADRFRVSRTFLLGDAAHVHSPLGGQGMNTGIADAVNLGWKLAAVLDGRASGRLLDSFERERIGFARTLVRTTDTLFTLIAGSRAGHRIARKLIFRLLLPILLRLPAPRRALAVRISQIQVSYRTSPLSSGRRARLRGGDRLPWVELEHGRDNFEPLATLDWQLHVYGAGERALRRLADCRGLPLHAFPWNERARRAGLRPATAYLVRPDGHLAVVASCRRLDRIEAFLDEWEIVSRRPRP